MASATSTPGELLARWTELSNDDSVPYPLQLLAEEFGYSNVGLLQTRLVRLGVKMPRLSQRVYERDHMIGEIKFLRAAGQGVAAIAQQLGLPVDVLIRRVHDWFTEGLLEFDLRDKQWTLEDEQWKSGEFALGPGARNGRHGKQFFKNHTGNDVVRRIKAATPGA
jgi:hypothetical protein